MFKTADFILLIFNCQKYKYKAIKQKQTWLKEFNLMPFFHVIGDPLLTTEYTIDETDNILYVKVEDDYNSLPKKMIQAFEAINKEYMFKYIFKTDDDQNLIDSRFIITLIQILIKSIPKIHYGGQVINVTTPHISQYYKIHPELPNTVCINKTQYCSGRFYFLSDLAIQHLLTNKNKISAEYIEDYAIGYYLDPVLKKNMLHINTNTHFVDF